MSSSGDQQNTTFNLFTLSFADDLEKEFQASQIRASLRQVRIALLLGIFFYALFGFLDACVASEAKLKLWFIRYVVLVPYALSVFFATYTRYYEKYRQFMIASAVMVAGIGIIAMIVLAPPEASQTYYAGLVLVFIYGYTFLRLRFIWASITGWLIVGAYEIAAIFLKDTPITALISNNFFFLTGNILLMFACYSIEYYLRRDFIQARMLESEKKKVIESNVGLEKRVQERTAELTRINEELRQEMADRKRAEKERRYLEEQLRKSQKMEALGTLAGGVAHDLNNMLTAVVSYPDLLLLNLPEGSPLRKPLLTIQTSGQKAAALVQDLLTMARRGVRVTEVVNLNDVVTEYLESPQYEKLLSYHPNVQLETNSDPDILNVLGSPIHLFKTMMNLVSNAAEAMSDGGKISISINNEYVDKPMKGYEHVQEGDYVVLSVSDTGVGISPEDIDRIFEPFYTKKVMGRSGTGLGMAVVWGTVKDHNGYIDVQSTEGKGTVFTLYFPATRVRAEAKPHEPIQNYRGKGESILIVDDIKEQREIVSGILQQLGYSAMAVSSGEEAIEYVKSKPIDLLVLDMIMDPGIDGLETYKRILNIRPGQKAIIASGFSRTKHAKEAQKLGVGAYLGKPYSVQSIAQAVRTTLDR